MKMILETIPFQLAFGPEVYHLREVRVDLIVNFYTNEWQDTGISYYIKTLM